MPMKSTLLTICMMKSKMFSTGMQVSEYDWKQFDLTTFH